MLKIERKMVVMLLCIIKWLSCLTDGSTGLLKCLNRSPEPYLNRFNPVKGQTGAIPSPWSEFADLTAESGS